MKKNKVLVQDLITYAVVFLLWGLVGILEATGQMTSLLRGLLVPLCIYAILAVSLNLTVGILGELSLGHAGFMCVGAFVGAFFTKCMENTIPSVGVRFFLALLLGALVAGIFGILIGIPVLRLKGDYLALLCREKHAIPAVDQIAITVGQIVYTVSVPHGVHGGGDILGCLPVG